MYRYRIGNIIVIIASALLLQSCTYTAATLEAAEPEYVIQLEEGGMSASANTAGELMEAIKNTERGEEKEELTDTVTGEDGSAENKDPQDTLSGNDISEADEVDPKGKHVKITLADEGIDVFRPQDDGVKDYRYSISLMLNDDGGIDAWFASPGDGVDEYDWVTYRHSDDGGNAWSDEKVVLSPSPCTPDSLSVCDPDAFFYDGYYYVGYTSTINKNEKGLCNSVFLARSENPDGPYEKWNGSGWGGSPVPIVYFNGIEVGWGCGEPSFVVMDDTLYMYSTRDSFTPELERLRVTDIRTADLKDPSWPSKLEYRGHTALIDEPEEEGVYSYEFSDSWDVAYLEESKKFIALCANRRFKADSCLLYFESDDGVNFERVSEINSNVITKCHNAGIMADRNGHIKKGDPVLIGYSYGGSDNSSWGIWSTRVAPAVIEYTDDIDRSDDHGENLKAPMSYGSAGEDTAPLMLRTDKLVYRCTADDPKITIGCYLRDNHRNEHYIDNTGIKIENYDENIISVNEDNEIVPKGEGMTLATVDYEGFRRDICLCVMRNNKYSSQKITGFCPIVSTYKLMVNDPFIIKVRPMAVFEDWGMHELTNQDFIKYGVAFSSTNRSVCVVGADGTVLPVAPGEAIIKMNTAGGKRFEIRVEVRGETE